MFNCYFKRYTTAILLCAGLLLHKAYAAVPAGISPGASTLFAADTIKGVIVDNYANAIPGVKVTVAENPAISTVTDAEGAFTISAVINENLIITHPAYNVYKHRVANNRDVKLRLIETYLKTPDTIDVLYGTMAAGNNLGATASIYTNQITTTPATIFPYALTGRLPGLYTKQNSGYRSVDISPRLKQEFLYTGAASFGTSAGNDNSEIALSLRGQNPVTIIDGVQREFSSLDFESIESITVLKDALSTILLGQRSSGGVLLVTTKKPLAGTPRISFTAETGMQESLGLPTPLNSSQYAYLYNEALQNGNIQPAYDIDDFNAYQNGSDPIGHPDVNWFNTLLRKRSPIRKYNLSLNGGSNVARYVVSLGYLNQEGMFKDYNLEQYSTNVELNRYTINSNIDVNLGKRFNVALQLFGRIQDGNQPGATVPTLLSGLYSTPNNAYPINNPDGSFGGTNDFRTNLFSQLTRSGYILDYARDVMVNLDMTYRFDDFVKGLWLKAKGNLTTGSTNAINRGKTAAVFERTISPAGDTVYNRYGSPSDQTNAYILTSSSQFWYAQLSTGIDRQFGLHNASVMLFADQRQAYVNFDLPGKYTNLALKTAYNYGNKYFGEFALNYSGYDRYQPGKRFGLFYAAGLGWKISEESFIKDNASWINMLKLRATYGKTGNANIGYYTYRGAFVDGNDYLFGSTSSASSQKGRREQGTLTTVGATWEKANKFNVGIDFDILDNALKFTLDYYNDRYYDLMQQRGTSTAIIGASYPNENIGINRYSGTEFTVTYQNHVRDFNYFITANASVEKTKVVFMDEIQRQFDVNKRTGKPVGTDYGYQSAGIIQTNEEAATWPTFEGYVLRPGDIKLVDQNGDGKITQDFDIVAIGNTKPRIYYGTTLGFSYKGFDMSVLLQGVQNRIVYASDFNYGVDNNKQIYLPMLDRWTPANPGATIPRLNVGSNTNNSTAFTRISSFQRSGNYFRIKNVDIGYNLPYKWVKRIGISGLRIFANGLNLFTASELGDTDPEVFGNNVYPIQRVINTGVTIKL